MEKKAKYYQIRIEEQANGFVGTKIEGSGLHPFIINGALMQVSHRISLDVEADFRQQALRAQKEAESKDRNQPLNDGPGPLHVVEDNPKDKE